MLLRNSFSNTKKFFQETVKGIKSFFSCSHYQRLPRTSPCNIYHYSYSTTGVAINDMNAPTSFTGKELDKFCSDFADRWGTDHKLKTKKTENNENILITPPSSSSTTTTKTMDRAEQTYNYGAYKVKAKPREDNSREKKRSCVVSQKLKELEMIDIGNVDHVLDIEEVLHYYSRLTCPAYLDIVDKFFMDVYSEFFAPPPANTPPSVNSRPRHPLRSVRS